jgi:hypothetical protein
MQFDWIRLAVMLGGYALVLATSGLVVRALVGSEPGVSKATDGDGSNGSAVRRPGAGTIIGKCENFLILTFVLADALTGLALIFAAKSIVRSEAIKKEPRYYLAGTLVNFSFSIMIAYLTREVLQMIA